MNRLQRLYPSKQRITEKILKLTVFDFGAAPRGRRFSCKLADQKNHGQKTKEQTGNQEKSEKKEEKKK